MKGPARGWNPSQSPAEMDGMDLSSPVSLGATGQHPGDSAAFSPMPPSPDDLGDPGAEGVDHGGIARAPLNRYPSLNDSTLSQPFPLPLGPAPSLPTPIQEPQLDLTLGLAGAALPSTDVPFLTPPIVKAGHNLRLPSFDLLGIAAPHPDRVPLNTTHSFSSLGAGPLSKPEDPLHALSPALGRTHFVESSPPAMTSAEAKSQIVNIIPTVTPPCEPGTFHWGSFVKVKTAGIGSPPNSESGVSPNLAATASVASPVPLPTSTLPIRPAATPLGSANNMDGMWLTAAKEALTSELESLDLDTVKILSHALPCPSITGHVFAEIIAAVHEKTARPTAWINVFHAVPGRFTLSDLPKSPPSTPGPAVGGDEYFTSKVFDSAVAVPDYQLDSKLLPPSPRPVVPPGTVNISVVERYIPPTNINEFTELFTTNGNSLLRDRLIELSPNNGTLLFIYPTKTGAMTFMNRYLGPVLDPLLRSLTVIHDLPSDLGKQLGTMSAVSRLAEFDCLKAALEGFCEDMSRRSSIAQPVGSQPAKCSLIYAAKEEVSLDRATWSSDWWIKQEKPRIREIVAKYLPKPKKPKQIQGVTEPEITPSHLIQVLMNGVTSREYVDGVPTKGVEVGVFVIKKRS